MKAYLQELNTVQRQAVTTTEGPVLVIAGPGSGKTRVLTYRIAHLIEEGVTPWHILSLTFTNKAAKEMKERITKVVGDKAAGVWAGTFHSIFAKILRVESEKIGYPSNFTIYDSDDTKSVINSIIKEMNLDTTHYNVNAVRTRISSAKSNLISPRAYKEDQELMTQDRQSKRPHLHAVYSRYTAKCKRSGAMDFDDLLYQLFILLHKNPDNVKEKYQKKFRYLLVDEFQDTNYLQYAILRKLINYEGSPRNICVVGDDAQSIYGFRGATIDNILNFEKEFKGIQVFKLEQNYRSTHHIVEAANEVMAFNRKQIKKKIWTDKTDGAKITLIKAMADTEEGKRVADTILEQKNRSHLFNSDIAILYRTNAQSRVFEEYLRRYNIPYRVFGGLSFYQRKEVKDLIAYLRLAINPHDDEALKRVINYPRRGIGKSTTDKLAALANEMDKTLWETLPYLKVSARAKNLLGEFVKMVKVFGKKALTENAYDSAHFIAKQSKLVDTLKKDTTPEGIGRVDNVVSLLDGINEFVQDDEVAAPAPETETPPTETDPTAGAIPNDKSLASYLANIALHTALDDDEKEGDYVTLMSVHSAKGLEFKSVFVVGLEEKLFPSFMSLDTPEGVDEERRLFYVAITRAEQFLTLTYANSRYKFGQMHYNEASRFLEEISIDHLQANNPLTAKAEASRSRLVGNFKRQRSRNLQASLRIDPKDFKPSPSNAIKIGMTVLHMKFGEGEVKGIDGAQDNKVATILFKNVDSPERRIMLKFAKLQIVE